jgi:hypothetical protein
LSGLAIARRRRRRDNCGRRRRGRCAGIVIGCVVAHKLQLHGILHPREHADVLRRLLGPEQHVPPNEAPLQFHDSEELAKLGRRGELEAFRPVIRQQADEHSLAGFGHGEGGYTFERCLRHER